MTTPIGGNPELVEDGKTGLMAPVGNVEALAAAFVKLLGDRALHERLAAAARAKAATFTRERMMEGTMAALAV